MPAYLIDVNLPYYFSLWNGPEFSHQRDINDEWTDQQIWEYAQHQNLTIVTKDTDFSHRIILHTPPPRVIHLNVGNLRLKELFNLLSKNWNEILRLSKQYKLVTIFNDRIECIK